VAHGKLYLLALSIGDRAASTLCAALWDRQGGPFACFLPAASPKALTSISRTVRRWALHHRSGSIPAVRTAAIVSRSAISISRSGSSNRRAGPYLVKLLAGRFNSTTAVARGPAPARASRGSPSGREPAGKADIDRPLLVRVRRATRTAVSSSDRSRRCMASI
jgi:hypothetical protein